MSTQYQINDEFSIPQSPILASMKQTLKSFNEHEKTDSEFFSRPMLKVIQRLPLFKSRTQGAFVLSFTKIPGFSGVEACRLFSTSRTTTKVIEAVNEFLNLRKMELEQYETVDAVEKEETRKLLEKLASTKLSGTTRWAEMGLDGLDEVELVLVIESSLGITLSDDEFHSIHSVEDAVRVVDKYVAKPSE